MQRRANAARTGGMTIRFDRRTVLAGTAALAACVPLERNFSGRSSAKLRLIEVAVGGQLAVHAFDTRSGVSIGYRAGERVAMCSTFKTALAGLVLLLDQTGEIDAGTRLEWTEADLLSYAPFARERLGQGATMRELARAAQVLSDNTAANLLLAKIGGPERLTRFFRALGDEVSRLDRIEPALNHVPEGEPRDTTTPFAMTHTLATLLFAGPLDEERRETLRQWMIATRTGMKRVRAGLPDGWVVGDKTGSSGKWPDMGEVRADIGFAIPPGRAPLVFAAYHRAPMSGARPAAAYDAALAEVGEVIADWAAGAA